MESCTGFVEWYRLRVLRKTGREPAPSTLRSKRYRVQRAMRAAQVNSCVDLGTLLTDREAVEQLLDRLALGMTPGALATIVDALRDFGEYAKLQGWCSYVALEKADKPGPNPQKPIVVYSKPEMDLLLANARGFGGLRWWALLETVAGTGRRIGEVLGLEWDWLRLSAEPPHFHLPYTKNGRQAYVPLSTHLVEHVFTPEHMAALKLETVSAFGQPFGRDAQVYVFPWSYQAVCKRLQRYCEKLGVENRGFHCFRHTKATEWLARGVPIQAVSALLGHSAVQTTDRVYSHVTALDFARYVS